MNNYFFFSKINKDSFKLWWRRSNAKTRFLHFKSESQCFLCIQMRNLQLKHQLNLDMLGKIAWNNTQLNIPPSCKYKLKENNWILITCTIASVFRLCLQFCLVLACIAHGKLKSKHYILQKPKNSRKSAL